MMSNIHTEFNKKIVAGLAKSAKPDCPECHGRAVIDTCGPYLTVCKCVARDEKESK